MRRRKRRRRLLYACVILLLLLLTASIYGLWQPAVRISRVQIFGADPSLASTAQEALKGSYAGVIPRDSILFYSANAIRSAITREQPDIAAISIFRNGFDGLTIRVNSRTPIAYWCPSAGSGMLLATSTIVNERCFVFDDSGRLYATSTAIQLVNSFVLYMPEVTGQIGAILPQADKLPEAFNFARQLATLGSPVISVSIPDTAVDDLLKSGTHIFYVLGHEQNAFTALMSAKDKLNLADGSLDYVDLRFDGKMYLKRKGGRE